MISDFSKEKYLEKEGTRKLNVARVNADVYHYGWVRPPKVMGKKVTKFINCYRNTTEVISEIDYGPLGNIPIFMGRHPFVMHSRVLMFDWSDSLNYSSNKKSGEKIHKHSKLKNRVLSFFENACFQNGVFTFKNYKIIH